MSYENKTHTILSWRRSAEPDCIIRICSNAWLTNDESTRDDAASSAFRAKKHDGHKSIL
jgi:hypothetical protein